MPTKYFFNKKHPIIKPTKSIIILIILVSLASCSTREASYVKLSAGPTIVCPGNEQLGYFKKSGKPLKAFESCYQEDIEHLIKKNKLLGYAKWLELQGKSFEAEEVLLKASQMAVDPKKYYKQLGKMKLHRGLWDAAAHYFDLAALSHDDQLWINTAIRTESHKNRVDKTLIPHIFSESNATAHHRSEVETNTEVNFSMVRVDQADPGVLAGETSIISSKDGQNIWVVWTDSSGAHNSFFSSNGWRLRAARSTDSGQTWANDEFSIAPEFEDVFHFDPMTAYDPVNEIFYAGGLILDPVETTDSYYVKKWNPSEESPETVSSLFGSFDKILMTVHDEKLYMAEGAFQNRYSVSSDFGSTFSQVEWTDSLSGFISPLPKFDNFGCLYIVDYQNFLRCDEDFGFEKINAPNTSLDLQNMGTYLPGTFRSIPHRLIAFHPDDNRIIMIYAELESEESDDVAIWMTQSTDGLEWEEPWIITPDVPGDRFLPWLAMDSLGGIHISYADTRNAPQENPDNIPFVDMYYSYSSDMGLTWQETRVTPSPLKVPSLEIWGSYFFSDYLEMTVADSGDVFLAFPWFEGEGDMDMYVAKKQLTQEQSGINQGMSGGWFNPATSGSGFFFDIRPEDQFVFTGWFTHDLTDQDRPEEDNGTRWYTASGNYDQDTMDLTLYESSGGVFDDPQEVSNAAVGTVEIVFDGCNAALVHYVFNDGSNIQGSFPIQRAIPGTETLCQDLLNNMSSQITEHNKNASDFIVNQGLSSGWYNPDTAGSGFFFDIRPQDQFVFTGWFTHDLDDTERSLGDNGTRWYTASGNYDQNTMGLTLYESSGGIFDDSQEVNSVPVGTVEIVFEDCNSAAVHYEFNDGSGLQGSFPVQRAIPGTEALCEEL